MPSKRGFAVLPLVFVLLLGSIVAFVAAATPPKQCSYYWQDETAAHKKAGHIQITPQVFPDGSILFVWGDYIHQQFIALYFAKKNTPISKDYGWYEKYECMDASGELSKVFELIQGVVLRKENK